MDSHSEFELLAEQLATQIQTELTHRALAIVAFDGFGCCGKSTLAQALARRMEAVILETHDFHQPRGGVIEPASPLSYRRWDALQSVAAALALGRPARFAPIDWETHRLGAEIELGPRPLLILDGIGSHAVVLPAPPFRIFVDGRAENRMHRVANRDGREHAKLRRRDPRMSPQELMPGEN